MEIKRPHRLTALLCATALRATSPNKASVGMAAMALRKRSLVRNS